MENPQTIFNRLQETKQEQRELKKSYRQALENIKEYQDLKGELEKLRARKKQVEDTIKEEFRNEFSKLDDLKLDIQTDTEMLSDLTLTKMIKGEQIEIKDPAENEYEPVFSVRFRKV